MKYTTLATTIDMWRVELSRLLLSFQRGICDGKTGKWGTFRSIEEFVEQEIEFAKKQEREKIKKAVLKITETGFDCICKPKVEDYFNKLEGGKNANKTNR